MGDGEHREPAWDTPEQRMIGLERIASSIPKDDHGATSFWSATVAFFGDGDTVSEAEVFTKAADYFRAHPELRVASAHWTTLPADDGGERYQLELSVVPPAWAPPDQARRLHPPAGR